MMHFAKSTPACCRPTSHTIETISAEETLRSLWSDAGLAPSAFERSRDPELAREVLRQFGEAQELGITGVPAVRLYDNDAAVVGAQPYELYRRWVTRTLDRR